MGKTLFAVFARINSSEERLFMMLNHFAIESTDLKRNVFDHYKESVCKAMLYEPDVKRKKGVVIKECYGTEEKILSMIVMTLSQLR